MGQLDRHSQKLISEKKGDPHKKALTLLLMLENKEKGLGETLIKSLKTDQAKILLNLIKEKPLLTEQEIEEVTTISYQILIDQKDIMAGSRFIESVDKSIDPDRKFREKVILNHQSLLSLFSEQFLKKLGENRACMGLALLCKLAQKKDVIRVIKLLPNDIAQDVLLKYVRVQSKSIEIMNEFTTFMLEKWSQEKDVFVQADQHKQLASILEQSQENFVESIKKDHQEIDWNEVDANMFKLEDLVELESEQLDQVLDAFTEPKELGVLLDALPHTISEQIKARITDRTVTMIEEERSAIDALDEASKSDVLSRLIAIVRDQEKEKT